MFKWINGIINRFLRERALSAVRERANFTPKQDEAFRSLLYGRDTLFGGDLACGKTHLAFWSAVIFALDGERRVCGLVSETMSDCRDRFLRYIELLVAMKLGTINESNWTFTFTKRLGGSKIVLVHTDRVQAFGSHEFYFLGFDVLDFMNREAVDWLRQRKRGWENLPGNLFCFLNEMRIPPTGVIAGAKRITATTDDNPHIPEVLLERINDLKQRRAYPE